MTTSLLEAIFAVFSAFGEWIGTIMPTLTSLFWVSGTGLTFLGVLSLCGLAVSIILLLLNIIQNFLHFRG